MRSSTDAATGCRLATWFSVRRLRSALPAAISPAAVGAESVAQRTTPTRQLSSVVMRLFEVLAPYRWKSARTRSSNKINVHIERLRNPVSVSVMLPAESVELPFLTVDSP